MKMEDKNMTIEEAKEFLRSQGYFTDNLWKVDDVKSINPNFDDEDCQEVLNRALTSDSTFETIWFNINYYIQEINKEINDG